MADIKDHVLARRAKQTILPGSGGNEYVPAHAVRHQTGGDDEINVTNLKGVLADAQNADKILGRAVDPTVPINGQVLKWNGTAWIPSTDEAAGVADGENVGTGAAVFKQKDESNLQFKTLKAGSGVNLIEGPDDVTIETEGSTVPTLQEVMNAGSSASVAGPVVIGSTGDVASLIGKGVVLKATDYDVGIFTEGANRVVAIQALSSGSRVEVVAKSNAKMESQSGELLLKDQNLADYVLLSDPGSPSLNTVASSLVGAANEALAMSEKSGFVDGGNVGVEVLVGGSGGSYRKVSLTNTGNCLNNGKVIPSLSADYESVEVNMNAIGKKYLFSASGTPPAWSDNVWSFKHVQIAVVVRTDDYVDE